MKPIVCITALHCTTTLEQKLEKDLNSHTFENENRKGKKKSEHTQAISHKRITCESMYKQMSA